MVEPKKLSLPLSREDVAGLRAGDALLLSGPLFTSRDAGPMRIMEALEEPGQLP